MNVSHLFIRRPVTTTLISLALLAFGWASHGRLPVSDLPNVDFPTIQVTGNLPGASPETMAASVATPLEKEFSTIAGLDSMNSSSAQGATQVTLQFVLDRDIDAAAQDVQAAISRAGKNLPPGMPTPPAFQKVNPADQPILFIALTSPTLSMSDLNEYAENMIAQRVSQVSGVAQVQINGSQKYAVRVKADPTALASRGIGIDEVAAALRSANSNSPTGALWGAEPHLHGRDHRRAPEGGRLPVDHRGLPRRAARPPGRDRRGRGRRRERQDRGVVQQRARDHPRHPAPARDEHRRGREGRARAAAHLPGQAPRGGQAERDVRPLADA